jgi:hypothetical protein
MPLNSSFIFDFLGTFWNNFEDREIVLAYWDALIRRSTSLDLDVAQVNLAKSVLSAPVEFKSIWFPVVLSEDLAVDPIDGALEAYSLPITPNSEITQMGAIKLGVDNSEALIAGSDYALQGDSIHFLVDPTVAYYIAETAEENRLAIYNNFGFPIDFYRSNSALYLLQTQALWFALFTGPRVTNIELGISAIYGLPVAREGRVTDITDIIDTPGENTQVFVDGIPYEIPYYAEPAVIVGEQLREFHSLSDAVRVHDFYNDPDFFKETVKNLVQPVQWFHTFYPTIPLEAVQSVVDEFGVITLSEAALFLDKIHPEYTNYALLVEITTEEKLGFVNPVDLDLLFGMTANVHFNYVNFSTITPFAAEPGNFSFASYVASPATYADYSLDEETVAMLDDDLTLLDDTLNLTPAVVNNTFNYVNFFNQPGLLYEAENDITFDDYVDLTS